MARRKHGSADRFRVGKVTVYLHHGAWWLSYSEVSERTRRKVPGSRQGVQQVAAQVNSQVLQGAPTLLSFQPIALPDLRRLFLDYHEHVLKSSVGTLNRYRAATQHFEGFAGQHARPPQAHEIRPDAFATYLRKIEVGPNGHKNAKKRKHRDKGVRFILERVLEERIAASRAEGHALARPAIHRIAKKLWWDAGAVKADVVRGTFVRVMAGLGKSEATCPKSWRHSFATLLQDANVDPLIRQQTLGHRPTVGTGLGMTAHYTHTRAETQREQIGRALRRWPESLRYALEHAGGCSADR